MNKISICLLLPVLAGCYWTGERIIPINPAPGAQVQTQEAVMTVTQDQASLEQRFSDSERMDPVEMVTLWAQRYEELSRQNEQMRKDSIAMTEQNSRLQQDTTTMRLELDQTRKELEQCNSLLQDAHVELSKWKADVLGFREEMRQAQTAQLLALSKILRILGAESIESQTQPPQSAAPQGNGQ